MVLSVVAKLKVKEGHAADFQAVASQLVAAVNVNEPGCLLYTLNKGDDPLEFVMLERYENEQAVAAHRASDHFKTIGRQMGAFMDGPPELLRMTELA